MGDLLGVVILLGAAAGVIAWRRKADEENAHARAQGRVRYLRSAEFPAICSWCRNTGLAKKLFAYELVDGAWRTRDAAALLATIPDAEVAELSRVAFEEGSSRWK